MIPPDVRDQALDWTFKALNTPVAKVDHRLVGGAALINLGSYRPGTSDIDIIVRDEDLEKAKLMLLQDPHFRKLEVGSFYIVRPLSKYWNLDIQCPSKMGIDSFPGITDQHVCLNSIAGLKSLLESKMAAFGDENRRQRKGKQDGDDLLFVIEKMKEKGMAVRLEEVKGLKESLIKVHTNQHPSAYHAWKAVVR
jgi:hypothetical protein